MLCACGGSESGTMPPKVAPIKEALKALGLVQSRYPKVKELKKQVRKLQKTCHPDRTGNPDETVFKELMNNAEIVMKFIQEHPDLMRSEDEEDEGDRYLLQFLRNGEEVKHNNGSCTIFLGEAWGTLGELVTATEQALGVQKSGDQASFIVATESLLVEEIDHKNVTVTFWYKPKTDGRSKMLIQGKGYEAFRLWALPEILIEASRKVGTNPLALPPPTTPQLQTQQHPFDGDLEEGNVPPTTLLALARGFHSMELQLVTLCSKVASLEGKVLNLGTSLPEVIKEELSKVSGEVRKVEQAVSTAKVCNHGLEGQKTLEDVIKMSKETAETQKETLEAVKRNSEREMENQDLPVLNQINSNIQSLVQAVVGGSSSFQAPKGKITTPVEEPEQEIQKRCLVFTSSVGKEININHIEEKLTLKAENVETRSVVRDENDDQPESNLEEKMEGKVKNETDVVIIQCGSTEVTKARTPAGVGRVIAAAEALVRLAEQTSRTFDCDVFLSQAPPRYDDPDTGRGDLAKLTEVLNSTTKSGCMFLPKVHIVPQGRLANSGKQLETRYQSDGLHLTEAGAALLTKNIIDTIVKTRPDLVGKEQEDISHRNQGDKVQEPSLAQPRGGGSGRGLERSGRGFRGGRAPPRGEQEGWREEYRGDYRQPPPGWRRDRGGYNRW